LGSCSSLYAQEEEASQKALSDVFGFQGYLKDLRTVSFTDFDDLTTNNLIHNRLNFKFFLSPDFTFALESRNRIFYGESLQNMPDFSEALDQDNGLVDMSFVLVDQEALVFHSIIDRLWLNYSYKKLDVRLGRQRINWGMNLAWNPNDLFNAYSFIDFDYEERPGSDALRVQYYANSFSSLELAVSPDEELNNTIAALMYKFNRWNYDFQLLTANYNTDVAVGLGWAGNLKNAGFKGEATYFHPKQNLGDTSAVLSASISVDYAFVNSLYLNGAILLNSQGLTNNDPEALLQFYSTELSAKNLMPSRFSVFAQTSYAFSPIFNASFSTIYGVDLNLLFLNPVIGISIANNWELSLVGQMVLAPTTNNDFSNQGNSIFVRTKWSFGN
jgi:hypothetical protein